MASIRVVSAECNEIVEIMVFEMCNNDTAVQKLAFQRMEIALKRLIFLVFLVCNNFICVIVYAPSDCFYRTF